MSFSKLLQGFAEAGLTIAGEVAQQQARHALGSPFETWLRQTFPGAAPVGDGIHQFACDGWCVMAYEVAGTAVLVLDAARLSPREVTPDFLGALLARNGRSVFAKWCVSQDGMNVALKCMAAVPVGAPQARQAAMALGREVGEVKQLFA